MVGVFFIKDHLKKGELKMETIYVHGAPGEYVLKSGILAQLEDKLLEHGFNKVLIVHGDCS